MALRLGAALDHADEDPEAWIAAPKASGYSAAYSPLKPEADDATVSDYAAAGAKADILLPRSAPGRTRSILTRDRALPEGARPCRAAGHPLLRQHRRLA